MRIIIVGDTFWHGPRLAEAVMKRLAARCGDWIVIGSVLGVGLILRSHSPRIHAYYRSVNL